MKKKLHLRAQALGSATILTRNQLSKVLGIQGGSEPGTACYAGNQVLCIWQCDYDLDCPENDNCIKFQLGNCYCSRCQTHG